MANEAVVKKSTVALKKEVTFNTNPTVAATNVIRVANIDVDDKYDMEKWDEIANSKAGQPDIRGIEKTPGSISLNLRSASAAGTAPEGDILYEASFGAKNQSVATTVASSSTSAVVNALSGAGFAVGDVIGVIIPTATTYTTTTSSTTTLIKLSAAPANFAVGDIIQVPNTGGTTLIEATKITAINTNDLTVSPALTAAPSTGMTVKKASMEFTRITAINTNALSVSPNLSAAPDTYTDLRAGTMYKLALTDLPSFWMDFWRGDVVKESYGGNKISAFELDIQAGKVVVPKFTFEGISCTKVAGSYSLGAGTFTAESPIVAVSQSIKIGGTAQKCDKFGFKLNNEVYNDSDISSSGLSGKIHTGRDVSGSFSLLYRDLTAYTAFKNDTLATGVIVLGTNGSVMKGDAVVLIIPNMRYTATPIKDSNKLYQYDVAFTAQNGGLGLEDECVLCFM